MSQLRLAKYELLEELGHGGYGIVYRARDTVLGHEAALMVVSKEDLA